MLTNETIINLNNIVLKYRKKPLSNIEVEILNHTNNGLTYTQMSINSHYSHQYLSDKGYQLFNIFSKELNMKINKSNFHVFLNIISNKYKPPTINLNIDNYLDGEENY